MAPLSGGSIQCTWWLLSFGTLARSCFVYLLVALFEVRKQAHIGRISKVLGAITSVSGEFRRAFVSADSNAVFWQQLRLPGFRALPKASCIVPRSIAQSEILKRKIQKRYSETGA